MNSGNSVPRLRQYLEEIYDLPFEVEEKQYFGDPWFNVKLKDSERELFDIDVKIKNSIRLVIEVVPEKYAAFSIQDMSTASTDKKKTFAEYARQLQERKAKIEFYINNIMCDATNPGLWPEKWDSYRLRVSRSPICSEDEELNEAEIISSWTVIVAGMFLSLLEVMPLEEEERLEGGKKRIETNRYERNPVNRELCLIANGYKCRICGFDFEKKYGEIGRHFIHVHHIVPVSKMSEAYLIDPTNDLIPVCPNCHAMLHRVDPPLLPAELRERIQETEPHEKTNEKV